MADSETTRFFALSSMSDPVSNATTWPVDTLLWELLCYKRNSSNINQWRGTFPLWNLGFPKHSPADKCKQRPAASSLSCRECGGSIMYRGTSRGYCCAYHTPKTNKKVAHPTHSTACTLCGLLILHGVDVKTMWPYQNANIFSPLPYFVVRSRKG